MPPREIHTKDDVPLTEITERVEQMVDYFNDADRPFRDLFVEEVNQQTFLQELDVDAKEWEKLAEGEFPSTRRAQDLTYSQMTIRTEEYGAALGLTQRFIEQSTSDQIQRQLESVIEGARETEEAAIHDVVMNGVYDGSGGLWYDIPDHGEYTFSDSHSHKFASTSGLFDDSNAHEPHEHLEVAAEKLREHGWTGRKVCLCSSDFKRRLRDELAWDAQYHIPQADGMRADSLRDMTIVIDGVELLQTPYLKGDEFFVVGVGEDPIKMYQERPMQITRPQGGPVTHPGEIINASATMSFGLSMTNPLGAVHFAGDSVNFS